MIGYDLVCYRYNNTSPNNSQEMKTPNLVLFLFVYQVTEADETSTQRPHEGQKRRRAGPNLSGTLPIVALESNLNGVISAA